jgi:hypothetical protein
LAWTTDLGRNFVLSFHIRSVPQEIVNGISFFASEILNTSDVLVLLTPIKAYRIPVSVDKQKLSADITKLLKKDAAAYDKQRSSAGKSLVKDTDRLGLILSGRPDGAALDLSRGGLGPSRVRLEPGRPFGK